MIRPSGWRELPWYLRYRVGADLASRARLLGIKATHRHCRVEFKGPVRLGPGFSLDIPGPGVLIVGSGVDFRRDFRCEIAGAGEVVIGDGCNFTYGVTIQCSTSVDIGNNCTFAQGTLIVDGSHRFRDPDRPHLAQGYDYRPIKIGTGATVMSKCTIAADIGEHAMIGANSVVTRPIPAYTLAFGAPARPVEYFGHGSPPPGVPRSEDRRR